MKVPTDGLLKSAEATGGEKCDEYPELFHIIEFTTLDMGHQPNDLMVVDVDREIHDRFINPFVKGSRISMVGAGECFPGIDDSDPNLVEEPMKEAKNNWMQS